MENEQFLATRNDLIEDYTAYVENLAGVIINTMDLPAVIIDDLVAGGLLGLIEAAERFDFKPGSNFKGFAFHRIRGAMIDTIRRLSDFSGKAYRAARALDSYSSLREEYQHSENREERRSKKKRLEEILNLAANGVLAYRLSYTEQDNETRNELLNYDNAEEIITAYDNSKKISHLVETLPQKERLIIEEYYFHGLSFSEITQKYPSLSKSWVSKLHKRALDHLRKHMLEAWGEGVA